MSCRAWRATPQQARPPGATALPPPASPSRCCRRCSASIADQTGPRKPWIAVFAAVKIVSLSLLWFAAPGRSLLYAVLFFSLASVAAEFSTVFNDSMLPRLVAKADTGRISNIAWGLGYLGGMIVLIFVVAFMAASPQTGRTMLGMKPVFGLDPALGEDARATGPLAALWYFVFILPMFLFTPDARKGLPLGPAVRHGLGELRATLGEVRRRGRACSASCLPAWSTRTASTPCWPSAACSLPPCSAGRPPRSACSASSSTWSRSAAAGRRAGWTAASAPRRSCNWR